MANSGLIVHAGPHARKNCPVTVKLPQKAGKQPRAVTLTTDSGAKLVGQVCAPHPFGCGCGADAGVRIAFVLPDLPAGGSLRLTAELTDKAPAADAVTVSDDKAGQVHVKVGGDLLTTYRYTGNPARPCFFPVLGPGGTRVTRSWPITDDVPGETTDHHHHRSLWVAHGDVNRTDNWSEGANHAFQLHREILAAESGPVLGRLAASTDWTDAKQNKVIEEKRALTAYAVPGDMRIFDFEVCFTATECDVRFGDTKEGGILAFRVAPAMDGDHGGRIENAFGGVGEAESWGKRAHWCDYAGEIGGERLGIAVFDHPSSFRHPTYWHVRDYGMYTANPFGWHDFYADPAADGSHLLPRGASLDFRYRVYLHQGGTDEAQVAARYHDFAYPPRVEVVA